MQVKPLKSKMPSKLPNEIQENSLNIKQALKLAGEYKITPLEAQILLLHALSQNIHNRTWLIANDDKIISQEQIQTFKTNCKRRENQEPTAYITGQKEFYGINLKITEGVLDPRADTEIIVQEAINIIKNIKNPNILELGIGSGAISIALYKNIKNIKITATDANPIAIKTAKENAENHNTKINIIKTEYKNWYTNIKENYDLIISNPPYIPENDPHLQNLKHEPITALTSGEDGLEDIKQIIKSAPKYLNKNGWIILEHGYNQSSTVQNIMQENQFKNIYSIKDINNINRCTAGQYT